MLGRLTVWDDRRGSLILEDLLLLYWAEASLLFAQREMLLHALGFLSKENSVGINWRENSPVFPFLTYLKRTLWDTQWPWQMASSNNWPDVSGFSLCLPLYGVGGMLQTILALLLESNLLLMFGLLSSCLLSMLSSLQPLEFSSALIAQGLVFGSRAVLLKST